MAPKSKSQTHMEALKQGTLGYNDVFRFPEPGSNARLTNNIADNMLWIRLKFTKYKTLTGNVFKEGGFADGKEGPTLMFVAPTEIQETISHNWGDASNVAVRAINAFTGLSKTISDTTSLAKSGKKIYSELEELAKHTTPGAETGNVDQKADEKSYLEKLNNKFKTSKAKVTSIANDYRKETFYKYDIPMMYTDSPKPSYHFEFILGDTGDAERDVMLPIQMLKYLSAPSKPGIGEDPKYKDMLSFEFPHVCQVDTMFGNEVVPMINMAFAAVTSVQVDYTGPFRNGMPTKASITLTVTNIMPVYKSTLEGATGSKAKDNIISITSNDSSKRNTQRINDRLADGIGDEFDKQSIENFYGKKNTPAPVGSRRPGVKIRWPF